MARYIRMGRKGQNLFCPKCKKQVPRTVVDAMRNLGRHSCLGCNYNFSLVTSVQGVREPYHQFLRISDTRNAAWWHGTTRPIHEWMNQPETNQLHVGSFGSATHRARAWKSELDKDLTHFVKLRVKREAKIHPRVWLDDVDCSYATEETGVVRYINAYENSGSISLVGRFEDFELADVRCWNGSKWASCAHQWSGLDNLLSLR